MEYRCETFRVLLLNKHKNIARYLNLRYCTFQGDKGNEVLSCAKYIEALLGFTENFDLK